MSFPHHDQKWVETADFVADLAAEGAAILAPDLFWLRLDRINTYDGTFSNPDKSYDWAIIHKGQLGDISALALTNIAAAMNPVFANEVFVVFSSDQDRPGPEEDSPHLEAFAARLAERREGLPSPAPPAVPELRTPTVQSSTVVPEPGALFKFENLSLLGLREAMNQFYARGGYEFITLRDKTLRSEGHHKTAILMPETAGKRVLDIGCGDGFVSELVRNPRCFLGVDLADVALQKMREDCGGAGEGLAVMDAHHLGLPEESFDIVVCVETIEHVHDADAVLREIARVLKPGGALVINMANRNSLHLLLTRKLGYPEFRTNYQHIREFTPDELKALLEAAGLTVERSEGVLLYPYFGVPGVDDNVRPVVDDDPEMVEALRLLGDRGGPEYAYQVFFRARKSVG